MKELIDKKREFFLSGKTLDLNYRKEKLIRLKNILKREEQNIFKALNKDLNKSNFESYMSELGLTMSVLNYTLKHFKSWAKPKSHGAGLAHFPSSAKVYKEPYGVTLIISPWNYPLLLSLEPVIAAFSAGNTVILKPSAYSMNTSKILKDILEEAFSDGSVSVILGSRNENAQLLNQKFDYVFFTGSTSVGKVVAKACAETLTPFSLELGGKSPCIVSESANIDLAAKRIVWGKLLNAGQTCVAPDYIYANKNIRDKLIQRIKYWMAIFVKDKDDNNFVKMINEKSFDRVISLIDKDKVVYGGSFNRDNLKIDPTILASVAEDDKVMEQEIFGPILPIIDYENIEDVIRKLKTKAKPLALYIFTKNRREERLIINSLSFGGGAINDTLIHIATHLPFGGVGESGIGSYHGKRSFDTFTHEKTIVKKSNLIDLPIRYIPYTKLKNKLLRWFM